VGDLVHQEPVDERIDVDLRRIVARAVGGRDRRLEGVEHTHHPLDRRRAGLALESLAARGRVARDATALELAPFVWQPPDDDEVRDIRRMKARIEAERLPAGEDPDFHLKLGRGSLTDIDFAGRTDKWIMREVFRKFAIAPTPENFDRFFDAYIAALPAA
jgi:hypothetical protein